MTWGGFLLLFVTVIFMAVANVLLKTAVGQAGGMQASVAGLLRLLRQPAFLLGFVLTATAAAMWLYVLATQKFSTCYPLFVSLTYVLITLGAFYFLHERVSAQKLVGLVIIVAGITTVARG